MGLVLEPDLVQRIQRHLFSLCAGNTADRERKFYILQNGLMRDQVVGLKYEADRVIAVGIPVPVLVFFGRDAVDDQVAAVIAVQSADDIEECGLSRTAGTEDGHELVVPQIQRDVVEGNLLEAARDVFLVNILKLQHKASAIRMK